MRRMEPIAVSTEIFPRKRLEHMIIRILAIFVFAYLSLSALIYLFQRQLQYHPDQSSPGLPSVNGLPYMKEIYFKTEDGLTLKSWFVPPKEKTGMILVYYHGNGGHIANRATKAHYYFEKGYGVFLVEYRGYGGNPAAPSEKGLYDDARSAIHWLEKEGYVPGQMAIYGESLGSGPATQMALEFQPKALILEAPFNNAAAVGQMQYPWLPVALLLKDRYENDEKIKHIKSNLLIIHGDEDQVVPIDLSQKLYELANHPKEYVSINGAGHSDLYEHHAGHIITEWLGKQ